MTTPSNTSSEIRRRIGAILLRYWDPIGVTGIADARSEYEPYVPGIQRLVAAGASAQKIADHLFRLEKGTFGMADSNSKSLLPVAERLRRLNREGKEKPKRKK